MSQRKPIIGIAGGIGSGKSFVAKLFAGAGCLVINSDELIRQAYDREDVKATLVDWWGKSVLTDAGAVNRKAIAQRIFSKPEAKVALEHYLHPLVGQMREKLIQQNQANPAIVAFVWDTPLLFETGLNKKCDVVVYIEAPWEARLKRVQELGRACAWALGESVQPKRTLAA